MKQHPFDPLAFAFGLIFLGAGLPLLFSESGFAVFEGRWVLPMFLIVGGAAILATTRKRMAQQESVTSDTAADDDFDSVVR